MDAGLGTWRSGFEWERKYNGLRWYREAGEC